LLSSLSTLSPWSSARTKAYQAIHALVAVPDLAVALAEQRLRAVALENAQRITGLIAALDSNRFATRMQAREQLATSGEPAVVALRKKLAARPSLDVRRQIEDLLSRIERLLPPPTIQGLRVIEVMEQIGNPEAKQVLERLAQGPDGFRVTSEAKASMQRLHIRDNSKHASNSRP